MTSRARARTASRAVAASALLAVALTGCGGDEPDAPSQAAGPADRAQVSTTAVPTSAVPTSAVPATPTSPTTPTTPTTPATTAPGASPTSAAAATPTAAPAGGTPDGTLVGVVRSADATGVTYDKVDERPASCAAIAPKQPVPFEEGFAACFSNVNPLLRTVPLAPGAVVRVLQEGDGPRTIPAAGLGAFLTSSDNTHPPAYTVFRIRVSGGRATALEQVGVSFT